MAYSTHHDSHRRLIDPLQFEEAGRAFRQWLDRLLGHTPPVQDTEIVWEDGEPRDDRREGMPHGH